MHTDSDHAAIKADPAMTMPTPCLCGALDCPRCRGPIRRCDLCARRLAETTVGDLELCERCAADLDAIEAEMGPIDNEEAA